MHLSTYPVCGLTLGRQVLDRERSSPWWHEHQGVPNGKKCLGIDRSCRLQSFLPQVLRLMERQGYPQEHALAPLFGLFLSLFFLFFGAPRER